MEKEFVLILDNIRSLFNVGAIFRIADAAKINRIYLGGISGWGKNGLNPKIKKTALGAEESVEYEHYWRTRKIVDELKKQGFKIVALERTKISINYLKFKPKFPLALIVGNEKRGVSKSLLKKADAIIEIPMLGKKESLNVAIAAGIAIFKINEFRFKKLWNSLKS
jgi:tRNA G18 (ribose-2'-O)-methylase SpoU